MVGWREADGSVERVAGVQVGSFFGELEFLGVSESRSMQPWAVKSFSCTLVYFISDSSCKTNRVALK